MICDSWSSAAQQKVADALRASLDVCNVRLSPRAERRLIVELTEQLECVGWPIPPISHPEEATGDA